MLEISGSKNITFFKTMIYLFIDDKKQGPSIAFRLRRKQDDYVFIDASCRIYSSWQDFKEKNILPECQVAYPRNGIIGLDQNDQLMIDFDISPAFSSLSQVTKVTDGISAVAGLITTGVAVIGLFYPLTAPLSIGTFVAGGVLGGYGVGRSIYTLKDRADHEQSISLADTEARLHWLNIPTAPFSIAGGSKYTIF